MVFEELVYSSGRINAMCRAVCYQFIWPNKVQISVLAKEVRRAWVMEGPIACEPLQPTASEAK